MEPRAPQTRTKSAPNSDEILDSGSSGHNVIPQRPPRQNRGRSDSTSSPIMSGSQYLSHYQASPTSSASSQFVDPYYSSQPIHHQQYSQYPSSRPSPRSQPTQYPSNFPNHSSPMNFQLPPSAMSSSSRDDSLRFSPRHSPMQAGQGSGSYRSPHVSPGLLPSGAMPPLPPLSLPESFLEDQSDYAGYYSDVGTVSIPQLLPSEQAQYYSQQQQLHHHRNYDHNPSTSSAQIFHPQSSPIAFPSSNNSINGSGSSSSRHQLQQQTSRSILNGNTGSVLPSPNMTPTASPLSVEFPALSLAESAVAVTSAGYAHHQAHQGHQGYQAQQHQHQHQQQQQQPQGRTVGNRAYSNSISTVSTDDSLASRNSLMPRYNTEPVLNLQSIQQAQLQAVSEGFYQGQPQVPADSFVMPTQEQYPPDSLILFGGSASHSEGGMFRKDAKEYLMLTNSSLLKYKSMEKACKIFGNQSIWSSSSGHQLLTPEQTAQIAKDQRMLSLNSIVGAHVIKPIGNEPYIQLEYLASISSQPSTMSFSPGTDQVSAWMKQLRQGCNHHAASAGLIAKGSRQRQWILEKVGDDHISLPSNVSENDPTALAAGGMWRAYFKSQTLKGVPVTENAPQEAKAPLEGKTMVVVVGTSYIHLLPHNLGNGSTKEDMKDDRSILQYPLLTVKSIQYTQKDDTFVVSFCTTLRQRTVSISFVSARAREIIIAIRARIESLRWLYPVSRKGVELTMPEDLSRPIPVPSKAYLADLGFEDLLKAECNAMNVDRKTFKNVKVDGFKLTIDKVGEGLERRDYSVEEMKVILRAIRFNTTFKEISFKDISFKSLNLSKNLKDGTKRFGLRLDQEFYEMIMSNPQLRSLDVSNCKLETNVIGNIGRAIKDCYAMGLRLEGLNLSGNNASDGADMMLLAKGVVKHAGTLHLFDVGNCQMTGDGINQLMHAFVANADVASHTLEHFGINGNGESKVNSYILDMFLKHSMRLEHLNLSDLTSWSKSPILMAETLASCGGSLRSLDISGMALHPTTLDQLLSWISCPGFDSLEVFKVEGCGLDGLQFSQILETIKQSGNDHVEIYAGRNLLSDGGDLPMPLLDAFTNGDTSSYLGLKQTCWSETALRQLFSSLSQNSVLKKLDISAVSLASGRDPDVETCKLLGQMLGSPHSRLQELFLQGEETEDLTSRMGRNLWRSFPGFAESRYLTKLDVRRNRFKDEGAQALAEALRVNMSLTWLDMDENDVTLDGYNAILSAFHQGGTDQVPTNSASYNSTLAYFAPPLKDMSIQKDSLTESMLETYKTEQETRFLLIHSKGNDAKKWKERLAQIIRTRNTASDTIARLDRTLKGIATAVERNKTALEAVYRDRERRREYERDMEADRQRARR